MKIVKRLNAATVYLDKQAGSNAKFYVKIDNEMIDGSFDSEQDAINFIQDWTGTDDSTSKQLDVRVVDSGFVEVFKPLKG